MFSFNFNIISTLILSIFLYILGDFIKKSSKILRSLCIPTPVIGGVLFALLIFILKRFDLCKITMDTSLMPYFLSIFFISIGLCINISTIKKGGSLLFKYWILCSILGFLQNIVAVVASRFLNINPLLGLMCGSISMEGGHGYSLAFGQTIESLGIKNAISIGIASATLGLILGGLLGGPLGKFLIKRYNLKQKVHIGNHSKSILNPDKKVFKQISTLSFFENTLVLLVIMNLSFYISNLINANLDISIPNIVIGMILAVFITTIDTKIDIIHLNFELFNYIQDVSLGIFLTMALMSIDIYTLSNLFGPIIFIVFLQVLLVIFFGIFICFRFLGKNYDAAVIVSGLTGHALGATPNALANMTTLTNRYGQSKNAFLVVPLVCAFLLDSFSIPCILFFINFLK